MQGKEQELHHTDITRQKCPEVSIRTLKDKSSSQLGDPKNFDVIVSRLNVPIQSEITHFSTKVAEALNYVAPRIARDSVNLYFRGAGSIPLHGRSTVAIAPGAADVCSVRPTISNTLHLGVPEI